MVQRVHLHGGGGCSSGWMMCRLSERRWPNCGRHSADHVGGSGVGRRASFQEIVLFIFGPNCSTILTQARRGHALLWTERTASQNVFNEELAALNTVTISPVKCSLVLTIANFKLRRCNPIRRTRIIVSTLSNSVILYCTFHGLSH